MESNIIFVDIKGYEDRYQISNEGRIWNIIKQRYMPVSPDKNGYLTVYLTAKNGKVKLEKVHRLVALMFVENPNNYTDVIFKDGNIHNIKASNLEWGNRQKKMIEDKNNINNIPQVEQAKKQVNSLSEMLNKFFKKEN